MLMHGTRSGVQGYPPPAVVARDTAPGSHFGAVAVGSRFFVVRSVYFFFLAESPSLSAHSPFPEPLREQAPSFFFLK